MRELRVFMSETVLHKRYQWFCEHIGWQAVLARALGLGLFILVSGDVWLGSGSARNTQVYLWLLLPALIYLGWCMAVRRLRLPCLEYWPWLLMLAWMALSALWATEPEVPVSSQVKRGLYIALFLLAIGLLYDYSPSLLRRVVLLSVSVVALGSLATLLYQFLWLDRPLGYRAYRIYTLGWGGFADYQHPVVAGIFHGSVAAWAFGMAVERKASLRQVAFWLLVFTVLTVYVLLSYSRGAWVSLFCAVLASILMQRSRLGWCLLGVGGGTLALIALLFRESVLFELQSRQLSGRSIIWEHVFEMMSGHWLYGQGLGTTFSFPLPNSILTITHAHSLYLQQVYDSGLVALLLLLWGLSMLCLKAWRLREHPWVRLAFPVLVFALVAMLTDVERIFTRPNVYWTLFWLPVAILLAVRQEDKELRHSGVAAVARSGESLLASVLGSKVSLSLGVFVGKEAQHAILGETDSTPAVRVSGLQRDAVSSFSVTLLSLGVFYIYMLAYAVLVFLQFSVLQVLSLSLVFIVLLAGAFFIFLRPSLFSMRPFSIRISWRESVVACLVSVLIIVYSTTLGSSAFAFSSSYVSVFPLLETELGLGWHQDTAFHVSLIQSILNFGYPSTAQHGHPLTGYHVLSHYADALILFVTRLDAYDSYGLLFHFKVFFFLSAVLLTTAVFTRRHGICTYLLSVILLIPCILGTWHAIGSHGLWMASIILVMAAPYIHDRLSQSAPLSNYQFAAFFAIIIAISLAKISSGFMLAAFVGAFILVRQYERWSTYLFGVMLLLFFYSYGVLFFSRLNDLQSTFVLPELSFSGLYDYLVAADIERAGRTYPSLMPAILACSTVLFVIWISKPVRSSAGFVFSGMLAILCLYIISSISAAYTISDIWYFQYGLSSVMLLFSYALVLQFKRSIQEEIVSDGIGEAARRTLVCSAVIGLTLLMKSYPQASFNVFKAGPDSLRAKVDYALHRPFLNLNKKLPEELQLSVLSPRETKLKAIDVFSGARPLSALKHLLERAADDAGVATRQMAVFIPQTVFDTATVRFGGQPWASGLLFYAVTGIQLVNAAPDARPSYGFSAYSQEGTRVTTDMFFLAEGCKAGGFSHLAIISQIAPPALETFPCPR
ncbi:hypothetical protein DNJ95_12705 [Stutzerimonas kirkiae]|uniref:O-antigen ligase-related domain-containing protein n=1 Tax=Stutzerimonas kirkiae TaxID=2211392 RepID=A0A4Q9R307_9GAMM|nr:O-antigen ligase family protein [Stutzerimonas kirkiae]TBU92867.1 hypothetical protein DNJ96_14760 [Stutzerimonas kirkiae]TBV01330.1 hypothetical protein DNJ95_12705 [Stutzerimonas kirkiae]